MKRVVGNEEWSCIRCGLISSDEIEESPIQYGFQPTRYICKRCGGIVLRAEFKR